MGFLSVSVDNQHVYGISISTVHIESRHVLLRIYQHRFIHQTPFIRLGHNQLPICPCSIKEQRTADVSLVAVKLDAIGCLPHGQYAYPLLTHTELDVKHPHIIIFDQVYK